MEDGLGKENRRAAALVVSASLVLGFAAALLPRLLQSTGGERLELMGLSSAATAVIAAALLAVGVGASAPEASSRGARLALLLSVPALILLPALLFGADWDGTIRLLGEFQAVLGWDEAVALLLPVLAVLALLFAGVRLLLSFRRARLTGLWLPNLTAFILIVVLVQSRSRLENAEAYLGVERLEKRALLFLLLTCLAAALAVVPKGFAFDPRTVVFGVGFLSSGLLLLGFTSHYLNPRAREIVRVLGSQDSAGFPLLVVETRGRPDLHAVFVIPNASATPELAYLQPSNRFTDGFLSQVRHTRAGWAYFATSRRTVDPGDENTYWDTRRRLRVHSSVWPFVSFSPGLPAQDALDWWIAPDHQLLLSSSYDRHDPNFWPPGPCSSPRVALDAATRSVLGSRTGRMLSGLSSLRILDVDGPRIRILASTFSAELPEPSSLQKSPPVPTSDPVPLPRPSHEGSFSCVAQPSGRLATATYDYEADSWSPWSMSTVSCDLSNANVLGTGDHILASCPTRESPKSSWCIFDAANLKMLYRLPLLGRSPSYSDRAFPLGDERIIRLTLTNVRPITKQATVYNLNGKEIGHTPIGADEVAQSCGELANGDVALAIHRGPGFGRSLFEPIPGWSLEAWSPTTGVRRPIASNVSAVRSQGTGGTCFFIDSRKRLLTPSPEGLRVVVTL